MGVLKNKLPSKNPKIREKEELLHKHAIRYAKDEYENNPLGILTRILTKAKLRHALYMGLVYMRWLDYIADESPMSQKDKIGFLKKSLSFLGDCKKREFSYLELMRLRIEERCAYYFTKDCTEALKDRGASKQVIDEILASYGLMIKSILQDTENHMKTLPAKDFYGKVYYLKAGVGIREYAYSYSNNPSKRLLRSFEHIGYIWQMTNDNLDIADDLEDGIINITEEEALKHGIDFNNYKGNYPALVNFLSKNTTFFEDRVSLLKKWEVIVREGFPDMTFRQRLLVRRYLSLLCPNEFKPGSKHYRTMQQLGKFKNRKKIFGLLMLSIFFISRNLTLFLMDSYERLKGF
ncbi:MAG: class 1 isoprenoid biosynthesis enzyme [Candidatus Aenigmatarchaeota archaeon]